MLELADHTTNPSPKIRHHLLNAIYHNRYRDRDRYCDHNTNVPYYQVVHNSQDERKLLMAQHIPSTLRWQPT
jgi:hypothetical protein